MTETPNFVYRVTVFLFLPPTDLMRKFYDRNSLLTTFIIKNNLKLSSYGHITLTVSLIFLTDCPITPSLFTCLIYKRLTKEERKIT